MRPSPRLTLEARGNLWGGMTLRIRYQTRRRSAVLPTVGACLLVYAVCAVGFHWVIEPTLANNPGAPAATTVVQSTEAAFAARAASTALAPVAATPAAPTAAARGTTAAPKAAAPKAAAVAPAAAPKAPAVAGPTAAPTVPVASTAAPAAAPKAQAV